MSPDPVGAGSQPEGLPILWHDASCLVLDKPAGISTQAPGEIDSVERRVRRWLAALALTSQPATDLPPYLGIPHRLDRCTSGVIVFALRRKVARKLSRQFERREVRKTYWALVEGQVEPPAGTWRDAVRKVPDEPRAEVVDAAAAGARWAELDYRVIAQHATCAWLQLAMATGRMHQIRLQAAARGHAIVGDALYGSTRSFGPVLADPRARAIALHAAQLGFRHPATGRFVTWEAPLPVAWRDWVGSPAPVNPSEPLRSPQ